MGIYRTYFDKNNTIIKNSTVNTGKNPVSELYYGQLISRFLFYCSFDEIISKYNNQEFTLGTTKHYLKIKNTCDFDVSQTLSPNNDLVFTDKYHASSFDLEVKAMKEYWDEGIGYDFSLNLLSSAYPQDNVYISAPSNWYNGTTTNKFYTPGGTLSTSAIATQHFDSGNEDIMMDITDFVNELIVSGVTTGITSGTTGTGITYSYQGFCLKYTDSYENYSFVDKNTRAAGLFTKYTQTFFEPFIETVYDDLITDDRTDFFLNKTNRLYLYVNIDGTMSNLDSIPVCTINGQTYPVTQQTAGVYYATIFASGTTFDDNVQYTDVWSNLSYNGIARPNVTLKFIPKEDTDYYQIGSYIVEPKKYGISTSGIQRDEKVPQGNVRKVYVHVRKPYTVANQQDVLTNLFYRMYIKQGANEIEILDWQPINKTFNSNNFTVDTTWLVPQIYYIDVKVVRNGQVDIYNEELRFTIPSKINF